MAPYLVCLDDSPAAPNVLVAAEALARAPRTRWIPFHAVGWPHEGHALPEVLRESPDEILASRRRAAVEALDALLPAVSADLREDPWVVLGVPWDAICRSAREIGATLIIMGAHRYHGLDRLLGTTSSKVMNHAHCSVLVVR